MSEPIRLPRWLGTPSPKTSARDKEQDKPAFLVYEWDEYGFRTRAEDVMRRLPEHGVVLILGEPGQGKSTLLREWQDKLEPRSLLGECRGISKLGNDENILEVMFQKGINNPGTLNNWPQKYGLVLLVDGLDELRVNENLEAPLADAIRDIATNHTIVMSCRTSLWQGHFERIFRERRVNIQHTYTLLGITLAEQLQYLKLWASQNGYGQQEAETLAKKLSKHPQLRSLAANGLLLELIASVALSEKLLLPNSKAEFYQKAIEYMWKQKRETLPHAALIPARDRFLRILGLKTLDSEGGSLKFELLPGLVRKALEETTPDRTEQKMLLDLMQKIGLLVKANPNSSELQFVHLAFQEYALAQGLILGVEADEPTPEQASKRLEQAIKQYGNNELLELTLELASDIAEERFGVRTNRLSTYQFIQHITSSRDSDALGGLAANPNTPIELLRNLASSENSTVLSNLAGNPNTPIEVLRQLANSSNKDVLWNLAGNPNAPLEILKSLSHSADSHVLRRLASNVNTPADLLQGLVNSEHLDVLWSLAGNPSTSLEILNLLAAAEDIDTLERLAGNPKTPPEILQLLASNENTGILWNLAGNPSSPSNVLQELAYKDNVDILENLAENPATPIYILEYLAELGSDIIYTGLTRNPITPPDLLRKIAEQVSGES